MIQIRRTSQGYRGVLVCDACEQPIVDAAFAVAARGTGDKALHLHKGLCHRRAELDVPAAAEGFEELREHLLQLTHNSAPPARATTGAKE